MHPAGTVRFKPFKTKTGDAADGPFRCERIFSLYERLTLLTVTAARESEIRPSTSRSKFVTFMVWRQIPAEDSTLDLPTGYHIR